LQRLERESLDLVCVVRGGGSPLDLAALDDEQLALGVAHCKYPVWVGIGHEIDIGVLDHVAHTSHKTPTAVAEALVHRIRQADERLLLGRERLVDSTLRRQELLDRELRTRENGLSQGTRKQFQLQTERFARSVSHLETVLTEQAARHEGRCERSLGTLRERTRSQWERADDRLTGIDGVIQRQTAERLMASQRILGRAHTGLMEGGRKQLSWIQERLWRRSERVHSSMQLRFDRQLSQLHHCRSRLQAATTHHVRQSGERQARARVAISYTLRNRLSVASEKLTWVVRSWEKVLRLLDQLEVRLQKWTVRFSLQTLESRRVLVAARLNEKQKRWESLRPEQLLKKGYSISRTVDGKIIRSAADVMVGAEIVTQVQDGVLTGRILRVKREAHD